jgi:hypothetical protein
MSTPHHERRKNGLVKPLCFSDGASGAENQSIKKCGARTMESCGVQQGLICISWEGNRIWTAGK